MNNEKNEKQKNGFATGEPLQFNNIQFIIKTRRGAAVGTPELQ